MKIFTNDELRKEKLFKFILDISEKEIHNMGFQYFDKNIHYDNFLGLINRILDEYFQISVNKITVIKFKENFEEYKNSSIIGDITISSNKDGNIPSKKIVRYNGDFVYYSILNHWLFSRVFNDEIENENKVYTRVSDILGSNNDELNLNPSNDLIIRPFKGVITNEFLDKLDVRDYVQLFLDKIKEFEDEQKVKNPPFKDEIIVNKGVPKYNLPQRLYLLEKIKLLKVIKASTNDEKIRIELLAIILNISKDNSRKLLSGTYGGVKHGNQNEVDNYIDYNKIGIIE